MWGHLIVDTDNLKAQVAVVITPILPEMRSDMR